MCVGVYTCILPGFDSTCVFERSVSRRGGAGEAVGRLLACFIKDVATTDTLGMASTL